MLEKSTDQVRACRLRAYDARTKADAATDPVVRADYLAMEERWLTLARSYEVSDRIRTFTSGTMDIQPQTGGSGPVATDHDDDARLHDISTLLIQEGDLDHLYGRILDAATDLTHSDCGSMQIYHPERRELRLLEWRRFHPVSAAFWQWVNVDHQSTCGAALAAERRVVVEDIETSALLGGTADQAEYRRCGIRAVQSTPLLSRAGDLLGMISTHWADPHLPAETTLRRLDILARQAADLIERGKVEARLRESEQKNRWLASIVESTDAAIISTDLDGRVLSWNPGAQRIFGYLPEEVVGRPIGALIPRDRDGEHADVLARICAGEQVVRYETVRQCKDGRPIDAALTVSPVRDAHGAILGLSGVVRDITEQKQQEEQIAVLAREAEHRTKNVLAAVQAVVNLSRGDSMGALKRAIRGRIAALAKVHALFIDSRWTGADLLDLATQELAPYRDDGRERVSVTGPAVSLTPTAAQCVAVILHELATNAAKYGSLSTDDGRLDLGWSLDADGTVRLRWRESDGPPAVRPSRRGIGMKVMETMVAGQLRGAIQTDWRPEGLGCEIDFRP